MIRPTLCVCTVVATPISAMVNGTRPRTTWKASERELVKPSA